MFVTSRPPVMADVASHYKRIMEDGSASADDKKAAALFVEAESKLNNEEDHEGALKCAQEALNIFKGKNNEKGKADTIRMVVHAHVVKAEQQRWNTPGGQNNPAATETLQAADKLVSDELAAFKGSSSKYGEACMLHTLSELNCDRRGNPKRREALTQAQEARKIYQELGDKSGDARSALVLANIYYKEMKAATCMQVSKEAAAIFRELGDLKGEASAIHTVGVAHGFNGAYQEAAKETQKALNVFKRFGSQKLIAHEWYSLARWQLLANKNKEALMSATEAAKIFKEINYGKGWQANAVDLQVQAHLACGDNDKAMKLAEEAMVRFKAPEGASIHQTRDECLAAGAIISCHYENGDTAKALQLTEPTFGVCRDVLQDKQWQANLLQQISGVHAKNEMWDQAAVTLRESQHLWQELGDKENEGIVLNKLAKQRINGEKDYKAALEAAEEEMKIFKETGDQTREANALLLVATAHCLNKDNDVALSMATEAQRSFAETEDRLGEAKAHSMLAVAHLAKQDFREAVSAAEKSRKMAKQIGNTKFELSSTCMLADIHLYEDNPQGHKNAVKVAQEGVALSKKVPIQHMQVEALVIYATAIMANANSEANTAKDPARTIRSAGTKAEKPAKDAVKICDKMKEPDFAAKAASVYHLGAAHLFAGKLDDAVAKAKEAMELYKKANDKRDEVSALLLTAEATYMMGNKDAALKMADDAFARGKEQGDNNLQWRAQQLQHKIRPPGAAPVAAAAGDAPAAAEAAAPKLTSAEVQTMVITAVGEAIDLEEAGGEENIMDTPMMDAGMDSLSSVAFRNLLQKKVGFNLPASLMFDYPTPRNIVEALVEMSRNS